VILRYLGRDFGALLGLLDAFEMSGGSFFVARIEKEMAVDPNARLRQELNGRLERLSKDGLVDFKAMTSRDRNMSTLDLVWAVNNALRLSEDGKGTLKRIE
jgi:hypothetical protein